MSTTSFREDEMVVAAVEPVGIVGNLEELSTSPQAQRVVKTLRSLGVTAAETETIRR